MFVLLFCFVFSPLVCYQGPKISEKLECTQFNHNLRLVSLFPKKYHSWCSTWIFSTLFNGFLFTEQTGSRVAARIFQRKEVGWGSQCFTPTHGNTSLTSCDADIHTVIHWKTPHSFSVKQSAWWWRPEGWGGGGKGQSYKITAFFRWVTRRGAPNRLSIFIL